MPTALLSIETSSISAPEPLSTPKQFPVPWRNPRDISTEELTSHIAALELACNRNPRSADLRTCLGMAYAMNYQVYESMAALERARELDDRHFYAQFKYAELLYRLRALPKAEVETNKAITLATDLGELMAARRQLEDIRQRMREGTQKPEWNKSLKAPTLTLAAMLVVLCCAMVALR